MCGNMSHDVGAEHSFTGTLHSAVVHCDATSAPNFFAPFLNNCQVVLQVPIGVRREEVNELQIEQTNVAVDETAVSA